MVKYLGTIFILLDMIGMEGGKGEFFFMCKKRIELFEKLC